MLCLLSVSSFQTAYADRYTSPNYKIDASVMGNSFGGQGSSSSYRLVSSGGESVIGSGTGGSYKLGEGYVAQLEPAPSFDLTVETGSLSLGTVVAGTSQMADFDVTSLTNQTSYSLSILQNHDLQSGANTISGVSGSIGSPVAWSEGTTKGLGFTLVSGAGIPVSWGSGANYAAIPGSATTYYTRTGNTPYVADVLGMRFRLDVNSTQPSGAYSNTITVTGTSIP